VVAFTVHREYIKEPTLLGKPVVPFEELEETHPPGAVKLLVAMGFRKVNKARAEIYEACKAKGYEFISYVCSKATVWGDLDVGENTFVFENNVIQPFVKIGRNCVLWSGNHIGHDAVIGDHCFVTSHVVVSGNAKVGDYCFVGVNATLRDGVTLGASCVIGAGALILKDAAEASVFRGEATEVSPVPSHRLKGF